MKKSLLITQSVFFHHKSNHKGSTAKRNDDRTSRTKPPQQRKLVAPSCHPPSDDTLCHRSFFQSQHLNTKTAQIYKFLAHTNCPFAPHLSPKKQMAKTLPSWYSSISVHKDLASALKTSVYELPDLKYKEHGFWDSQYRSNWALPKKKKKKKIQ